ncbi:MAG: protein kinase [Polyangiaceae bacterium]
MQTSSGRRKVVGKYHLIAEIGHGGMADVFLAVAHGAAGAAKLSVIKEPRPEIAADPDLLEMFLDEARLASRLNHPNIVQTHEVGQDGSRYFIAMEYLEGQPLSRVRSKLRGDGGMPLPMQVRVLADALAGLHYAHELADYDGTPLDVVHRDVTPQNIFVTYAGQTKLVDFGIAKASSSAVQTKTGVLKGKMTYMSPEQARGDKVDRRTDVYAVGMLLWEAISKQRMYKGLSDIALLSKVGAGDLIPIRDVAPDVPDALARILARAMAPAPEDRYQTAAEMQEALEHYLAESGERRSAAAISALMTDSFTEERARIQGVIEQELRKVEPRATAESLPRIDPGRLEGTPSRTDLAGPTRILESEGSAPSIRNAGSLTSANGMMLGPVEPTKPGPRKGVVFAAAAVVGALAAGAAFFSVQKPTEPESSQAAVAAAQAPQEPSSSTVALAVEVTPAEARVLLDDAVLSTGNYEGKLPRDGRVYKLRVEAPGYTSRVELVTPTKDVKLSIALEKDRTDTAPPPDSTASAAADSPSEKKPAYGRPWPTAPATTSAAPIAEKPADDGMKRQSAPKPSRTLDTENPYK